MYFCRDDLRRARRRCLPRGSLAANRGTRVSEPSWREKFPAREVRCHAVRCRAASFCVRQSYLRASRVSCGRGAGGGCAFVRPAVLTLGSRTTWSERSLQGAESAQRAPYTSVAHFAAKTEQALFRRYGLTPSVGCGREGLRFDIQTALDTRETDLGVARRSRAVETLGGLLWKRRADVPCP